MHRQRFSASITFIPWNYQRSSEEVAELFASRHPGFSLCIHGCDHTHGEFASTDVNLLRQKAQIARERMHAHQRLLGVPCAGVMVFPQGLFSLEAMAALKASGYLTAVNTALCPSTMNQALDVRDLLDVAVTKFEGFPMFGRRYPKDVAGFALDLFLGKPALAVEHHGYFRDGYNALETFVKKVNSLDERLEWTNLETICSRACLTKTDENGDVYVRLYTNHFWLTNEGTQTRRYVLLSRQSPDGPSPTVTINGCGLYYEREGGDVKIRLSLDAGQTAEIAILLSGLDCAGFSRPQTAFHNVRVWVRRILCEFRDNYVDTNWILSAVIPKTRRVRSRRAGRN